MDVIFVIGPREGGKSTIIRSLTGCPRHRIWKLTTKDGHQIITFVILSSPQELSPKIVPSDFPDYYETKYSVNRNDYTLLIAPLELDESNPFYSFNKYILSVKQKGFSILKLGVISRTQNGTFVDITPLQTLSTIDSSKVKLLDAFNDPHIEARRIHP